MDTCGWSDSCEILLGSSYFQTKEASEKTTFSWYKLKVLCFLQPKHDSGHLAIFHHFWTDFVELCEDYLDLIKSWNFDLMLLSSFLLYTFYDIPYVNVPEHMLEVLGKFWGNIYWNVNQSINQFRHHRGSSFRNHLSNRYYQHNWYGTLWSSRGCERGQ